MNWGGSGNADERGANIVARAGVAPSSVPDVPGVLVEERKAESLRNLVARICDLQHRRFPGAQPVSFTKASLDLLKREDFWVCEKSDGQRVLMLIAFNKVQSRQEVYLIDRKNNYRQQHSSLFFPYHEIPPSTQALRALEMAIVGDKPTLGVRKDTLLDGELVWDEGKDGKRRLRLLLFDCIVLDGERMASRSLSKRYGRLRDRLFPPFAKFMRNNPLAARDAPFEIKIKNMDLAYGIGSVLTTRIPNLEHGNDGLIFTCINSGYVSGTDPKIIKWKPPSENTIDFKLRLRFPPDLSTDPRGNLCNYRAKPFFQLDEFMGSGQYRYFDWLHVEDEEWERMKASDIQFDDRIVECFWDCQNGPLLPGEEEGGRRGPSWRLHRIRDDKEDGNHCSTVRKILQSIEEGVEEDELLAEEGAIRASWKSQEREELRLMNDGSGPAQHLHTALTKSLGPSPPLRGTPPVWIVR